MKVKISRNIFTVLKPSISRLPIYSGSRTKIKSFRSVFSVGFGCRGIKLLRVTLPKGKRRCEDYSNTELHIKVYPGNAVSTVTLFIERPSIGGYCKEGFPTAYSDEEFEVADPSWPMLLGYSKKFGYFSLAYAQIVFAKSSFAKYLLFF